MFRAVLIAAIFYSMIIGCARPTPPVVAKELVLSHGNIIEGTNKNGVVRVEFVSELRRRISIDGGASLTIELIPRKSRFRGMLGAYNPGESWLSRSTDPVRLVYVEAERHFDNIEDAKKKLIESRDVLNWVTSDDGFVVGLGRDATRKQFNISIFRYYVQGIPCKQLIDEAKEGGVIFQERNG